jgi:hypothetical protein
MKSINDVEKKNEIKSRFFSVAIFGLSANPPTGDEVSLYFDAVIVVVVSYCSCFPGAIAYSINVVVIRNNHRNKLVG